ncbi:septum formation initiator [Pseudonocardia sp. ICBG1293]|uniref:septum formation initiator n=1 Tax=Pseudonocardia sp. ICBG1293 TaxID=2844382 RepID=UPI001CCB3297|nr:septum formation initiator [Pseudonocardia sp. ICBG1293]
MSTPVIERPGTPGGGRARPDTRQSRRTAAPPRIPAQRGPGDARRVADQRRRTAARENTGRAKFVLVVMVLLVSGLIATLWLSTAAAADSYALQAARERTASLTEQSEALRKEVTVLQSPGSLADRAAAQGMVRVTDPARLVVAPDGRVDVVGEPSAAVAPAPPAPPAEAPGEVPAPQAPPAAPQDGQPGAATTDPAAEGGDAAPGAAGAGEGTEREVPADTRAAGGN